MIWMEHPALGPDRKQEVSKKAFDSAWSRVGWFKCDPPPPPPLPSEFEVLFEDSQELEDSDYDDESEEQEE